MASEIRVNKSTNRSGLSTVTYTDSGPIFSGITTVETLKTTGDIAVGGALTYEDVTNVDSVGMITARAGLNVSGGDFKVGSAVTISNSGIVTATTYYGSGSNLTGIDATQIVTGNTSVQTVDAGSDGHIKFNTEGTEKLRIKTDGSLLQSSTGSFQIAKGTTAQRPGSPADGMIRFNTTLNQTEEYRESGWHGLSNKTSVTGGTVTTSGSYTIHTFTSSGTLVVSGAPKSGIDYLLVAGGGGGGSTRAGGGGAGGMTETTGVTLSTGNYTVTVGGPGSGAVTNGNGNTNGGVGGPTSFNSATVNGGGYGGGQAQTGGNGGSGGGGSDGQNGGSGTSGQGNAGGNSTGSCGGGGGGGKGGAGGQGNDSTDSGGAGGAAGASSYSGSTVNYSGGGGGGSRDAGPGGNGGGGGAGNGGQNGSNLAGNASANQGGGGGGGARLHGGSGASYNGGNGGSGIVIIRYLT